MKKHLHYYILACILVRTEVNNTYAQSQEPFSLFRIYEDNDFLNIRGKGTDESYSNGTRFDLFYTKRHPSRFFIDRWMPAAGNSSINVFGWGLMQIMFTPRDISKTYHQGNDYPYSGALFATHSLFSYNKLEKFSFQTEIVLGVRGPAALAKESQSAIHKLINYQQPMGWNNQLKRLPLINIGFVAEKQIAGYGDFIEIIGGVQLSAGSLLQAFGFYPMLRIGKMVPYFNGFISHYSTRRSGKRKGKSQFYLFFKPKTTFVIRNALVEGSRMHTDLQEETWSIYGVDPRARHSLNSIEYGIVFAHGNFSISYSESHYTEYNKGLYHHNVGNISLYFSY
ncbi:MAG TPA: lipid A deacylase LpxR family protein [Flavitalea sp.]|nr:lipid A deacylase LpxR family protein [Flavitalea sp.]